MEIGELSEKDTQSLSMYDNKEIHAELLRKNNALMSDSLCIKLGNNQIQNQEKNRSS